MSIDYSFFPVVGFRVEPKDLEKFAVEVPEKYHFEERWDSMTGTKLEPAKVLDERAHRTYRIDGKLVEVGDEDEDNCVDEFDAACHAIAMKIGCELEVCDDGDAACPIYFTATDERPDVELDCGRVTSNGPIKLPSPAELSRIGAALRELGIQVGEPVAAVGWQVC